MAPLLALLAGSLLFRLAGLLGVDYFDSTPHAVAGGLALMFVLTGLAHFAKKMRADMIAMVPPALPRPDLLITATGILELAGAAGLLVPPLRQLAAICLVLLLLAMFPANVSAARRQLNLGGKPVTALLPRTLLQIVFVAAGVIAALP